MSPDEERRLVDERMAVLDLKRAILTKARALAAEYKGEPMDGDERDWSFDSCAAAAKFCKAAEAAGLRAWGSVDIAGVLIPSDAGWANWKPMKWGAT